MDDIYLLEYLIQMTNLGSVFGGEDVVQPTSEPRPCEPRFNQWARRYYPSGREDRIIPHLVLRRRRSACQAARTGVQTKESADPVCFGPFQGHSETQNNDTGFSPLFLWRISVLVYLYSPAEVPVAPEEPILLYDRQEMRLGGAFRPISRASRVPE